MHPPSAYFTAVTTAPDPGALAAQVFPRVFRTDFMAPGFALVRLPADTDSRGLRRLMVALKQSLDGLSQAHFGKHLTHLSLARFDQQVTTKFHLDGAPAESFLLLGYEPSEVASELALADYSRAAHDLGITPADFLRDYNPMFTRGARQLLPYVTRLTEFDPAFPNLLLVNNSSLPFAAGADNLLGVMHQATVPAPRADRRRVINSAMLGTATQLGKGLDGEAVRRFVETDEVAGEYRS